MSDLKGTCPGCAGELPLAQDTESGEIIICDGCGFELEVVEVKDGKVVLEAAPEVDEDWGE